MNIADFAVINHCLDICEVMVKAAVKANLKLNACFLNCVNNRINLCGGEVNGLFAENMLACRSGFDCYVSVSIR